MRDVFFFFKKGGSEHGEWDKMKIRRREREREADGEEEEIKKKKTQ